MSDIDKLGPWKKVDIKSGYKDRGFMGSVALKPQCFSLGIQCVS